MKRLRDLKRVCRGLPLRWHLVLLIAGTLLPVVGFSAGMILRLAVQERGAIELRLIRSADHMADMLDARLATIIQSLEALARSPRFQDESLTNFRELALRVLPTQPGWRVIIIHDPQGRMLMNTSYDWDEPLPETADPPSLLRAIDEQRPVVGGMVRGVRRKLWAFAVRVPVLGEDGELRYILTAVLSADTLTPLVGTARLPDEWTRTIVDQWGAVAARTVDPDRWVGQQGTSRFLDRTRNAAGGLYADTTLEGRSVLVGFDHNMLSDWTTAVTAPSAVVQAPVRRSVLVVIGLGIAALSLSLLGAALFARRVSRDLRAVESAAEAMAEGRFPRSHRSSILEMTQLEQAIRRTSRLLRRRQQERDDNLARAELARQQLHELNETLEQRVARRTAEAEQRAVQLRALASQLASAEDRERRRVAQTLHDDLQQILVAAKMRLTTARGNADGSTRHALGDIQQLLDDSIRIARTLTSELSPLVLYDLGLPAALEWLGRHMNDRHDLKVAVTAQPEADLHDDGLRSFLLQAARELLFNVVKHAGVAEARVDLLVDEENRLVLTVADGGVGIDDRPEFVVRPAPDRTGLGLFGIRERLIHLGGQMAIDSSVQGETRVQLILPRDPAPPDGDDA